MLANAAAIALLLHQARLGHAPVYPLLVFAAPTMRIERGQPNSVPSVHLFRQPLTALTLVSASEPTAPCPPSILQRLEAALLDPLRHGGQIANPLAL